MMIKRDIILDIISGQIEKKTIREGMIEIAFLKEHDEVTNTPTVGRETVPNGDTAELDLKEVR